MNIKRLLRESAGDTDNTATIAFRIPESDKEAFVELCNAQRISIGRLMRAMVREFMEEMEDA